MKKNHLTRYPIVSGDTLLPWNAADELVVEYIENINFDNKRILVLNDSFGAISSNIDSGEVVFYTDSFISQQAAIINIKRPITFINDLEEIKGNFDFIILKIPKNYSFLEDILIALGRCTGDGSKLIATSMVKHLAAGAFDLINKYVGVTTTSLAKKKARIVFADFQNQMFDSPYPLEITIDNFDFKITNHSNVFSREKLDIGTRFFLEHIPIIYSGRILDLGCGNGLVGIKAKMINPKADIVFSDDSKMALLSAKTNYFKISKDEASFVWTNCFEQAREGSFDLVLCNPPFHQGHTVGDFVAKQMFKDAKMVLKAGGALRIIGNSHLGYQVELKKLFGNASKIAQSKKFTIWESIK
jgi:16S rRNA G1207 methylase RsmC